MGVNKFAHSEGWLTVVKWGGPAVCWGVSMFICMWLLHCGTYMYVRTMDRMERSYAIHPQHADDPIMSSGLYPQNVSYGSLEDPLEAWLGWRDVELHQLDIISALLPGSWLVITLLNRDLQAWAKLLTANSILAIWKGAFGFMTIVPDSIGWTNCQKRLKPKGLAFFRTQVPDPETDGYPAMAWMLLKNELFGQKFRFCADMMYSGHTYFTSLYALALVEAVQHRVRQDSERVPVLDWRVVVVTLFVLIEQAVEITLVLENRFHYTMDVVMAIILSLLLFTNSSVLIFAKRWATWDGRLFVHNKKTSCNEAECLEAALSARAPPRKSVMSACSTGRRDESNPWIETYQELSTTGLEVAEGKRIKAHLVLECHVHGDSDVVVPMCCVPFCCEHGYRYHMVADTHVLRHNEAPSPEYMEA